MQRVGGDSNVSGGCVWWMCVLDTRRRVDCVLPRHGKLFAIRSQIAGDRR